MPLPRSFRTLALLMLSLVASPAAAENAYLEYSAGLSIIPNQTLKGASASSSGFWGSVSTNAGYAIGAAVGYKFFEVMDMDIRSEIAIDYRQADLDSMNILPGQLSGGSGDMGLFTAMINGYIDYNPKNPDNPEESKLPVVPYLGLGVGYGLVNIDGENKGPSTSINDDESVFAWNLMAGMLIPYTKTVGFKAGYRYVSTSRSEFNGFVSDVGDTRIRAEFDAHEIMLGLRINF